MNIKSPTHGLGVKFVDYEIKEGHVDYRILVKNSNTNRSWIIISRFSALEKIHKKLVELNGDKALPNFPAKAFWGNLEPSFISQRQKGLEIYFMLVLQNATLKNIKPLLDFLDEKNGKLISDASGDKKSVGPGSQPSEASKDNNGTIQKPTQQQTAQDLKNKSLEITIEQIDKKFYDLQVQLNPPEDEEVRKRTSLYAAIKLEMIKGSVHDEFKLPRAAQEKDKDFSPHNPELQHLLRSTLKSVKTQFENLPFLQNCKIVKEFEDKP